MQEYLLLLMINLAVHQVKYGKLNRLKKPLSKKDNQLVEHFHTLARLGRLDLNSYGHVFLDGKLLKDMVHLRRITK